MHQITDLQTPIGDVIANMGDDGALIETPNRAQFAIVPLDDDLIDHFVETNPKFIAECAAIRDRMRSGKSVGLDEVRRMFPEVRTS